MKNPFDGLINRWDPAEGRISDLGDIAIEISHSEKQIEKKSGKTELYDHYKKYKLSWEYQKRREKEIK